MLTTGEFYSLGTQESAHFTQYLDYIAIYYSGGTGGRYIRSYISLAKSNGLSQVIFQPTTEQSPIW